MCSSKIRTYFQNLIKLIEIKFNRIDYYFSSSRQKSKTKWYEWYFWATMYPPCHPLSLDPACFRAFAPHAECQSSFSDDITLDLGVSETGRFSETPGRRNLFPCTAKRWIRTLPWMAQSLCPTHSFHFLFQINSYFIQTKRRTRCL